MITVAGKLTSAGELDGAEVTVKVDLEGLWEEVSTPQLVKEVAERLSAGDGEALDFMCDQAENYFDPPEPEADTLGGLLTRLSDYDRESLEAAIRNDNRPKVLELVARAVG